MMLIRTHLKSLIRRAFERRRCNSISSHDNRHILRVGKEFPGFSGAFHKLSPTLLYLISSLKSLSFARFNKLSKIRGKIRGQVMYYCIRIHAIVAPTSCRR